MSDSSDLYEPFDSELSESSGSESNLNMPGPLTKRRHREKKKTSTPQYVDQSHIIESNREVLESENNFEESGNRQERDAVDTYG